ncbi:MAG TPA: GTP 3',8-cyclase MoaA [Thermoanaerobaculia bacterium]|nr:GTP 3',8-cyclase MoaA [Thermoanaerobaculia bacterium]
MIQHPHSASRLELRDTLGRPLEDLRISVIDRCNFRCSFCMPAGHSYTFLPKSEILTFEEIARLARVFAALGVRKLRLTGGEPLLRAQIETLIEMLHAIEGIEDLALTTNGLLLADRAAALRAAGLRRLTVSVPSLDSEVFARLSGLRHRVEDVLAGIDAAVAAGFGPLKINVVVIKGVNEREVPSIARYFKERGHIVRFIEYMDVGTLNGWDPERVVSAREILERIGRELPIEPAGRARASDVADRFRYLDDGVELGTIASITEPFCGDCARARLTAEGRLYTCLFAARGHDLKGPLRAGADDRELRSRIAATWRGRADRYSEDRARALEAGHRGPAPRVEMYRIGG